MTQPVAAVQVEDNMGLAIFTTICCCWPIGIFAILRASESRAALAAGDFQRAQTLGQASCRFSLFAIAGPFVLIAIFILVFVVSYIYYYTA